jgi:glycosyltransferase involved in cell wall biosynthesis
VKIAIIHFTAPPVIGGVERVIREQISLFKNAGHCVTLACFEGGHDCKADCLVPLSREADRSALFKYLNAALSDSDVVLMHNVGTMPFAVELTATLRELAARIPHAKWICWVHDLACANTAYMPFATAEIHCLMTTRCEHWEYVAVSEFRSNQVRAHLGVDCMRVPNGISPAEILQLQPNVESFANMHEIWDSDLVLFHPARMVARKGIQTGVQVTKELRDLGVAAKYLLTAARDPHHKPSLEYESEIRALADGLDLAGQFIFVSDFLEVGPIELQNLYLLADALFFPSLQEGFGLPILEAAMFGTPAVCADIDPLNTLPGTLLYDPLLDPKQLAEWIMRHVLSRDSIKARRLVAAEYRWEQIYQKHLAPLLQLSK